MQSLFIDDPVIILAIPLGRHCRGSMTPDFTRISKTKPEERYLRSNDEQLQRIKYTATFRLSAMCEKLNSILVYNDKPVGETQVFAE